MDPNPETGVLGRGKFVHRYTGRTAQGKDWSSVFTSRETPSTADNHQKLGRRKKGSSPQDFKESTVLLTP